MAGRPFIAVVALGGHAFVRSGQRGSITEQFANARAVLPGIVELVERGHEVVLTHGNGPQIGNSLLQNEVAKGLVPDIPLGVLVANSGGGMGYMIEQTLLNLLSRAALKKPVITMLTQVLVARDDPDLARPKKPVGPFYSAEEARELSNAHGYPVAEDSGRGWRRVVPSPDPIEIIEAKAVRLLLTSGCVVVAAGGGGIPVIMTEDGALDGVDCVLDKDLASMVLARDIGADALMLLTSVEHVYAGFGTDSARALERVTVAEARALLDAGEFSEGSMEPKVRAAVGFLEAGGRSAYIGPAERAVDVIEGRCGTEFVP